MQNKMDKTKMITRITILRTVILITRLNELVTAQDNNIKPSLTISPAIVIEDNPQTLTCKYSGSQSVSDIQWSVNGFSKGVFIIQQGSCIAALPPNSTLYSYTCDASSNTFTLTIKNVRKTNRYDQWQCLVKVPAVSPVFLSSNELNPEVKVLITSVSMTLPLTGTITIEENTPQQFQCVTSGGLPEPTVKWYKDKSGTGSDGKIMTSIVTSYSNTTDGLVVTTSTLTFSPTKNDHKSSIYCSAFVGDQTPKQSTKKPELNVLYGPDDGALTIQGFTDGASYLVIENTQGHLTCLIRGGNPLPTLRWSCYNAGTSDTSGADTVSMTVRWNVGRGQDRQCRCYSIHFSRNESAHVQVNILYPPTTPVFYIQSLEVSGKVKVIRNNSVSINCSSSGKPNLIQNTWTPSTSSSSGSVLNINRVHSDGQYTCNVQNEMDPSNDPSNGDAIPGKNSSSVQVVVLYPPVVGDLVNRSVAEGDSLIVSCPVKDGNPPKTTLKWTNSSGLQEWRSQTLTISKVSRNDAKFFYTCEVENEMQETGKQQTVKIPDSKSFYLNVWYEASITSFFIEGHRGQTRVTVDENDGGIQFTCEVDSNPSSTVEFRLNGVVLEDRSNTKQLSMILSSVACLDGGEYTCEANNHHGQTSMKIINLYVNCSPRPLHQMRQNITSALHIPVTLSFTALAYPYPGSKGFAWFKEHNVDWLPVLSNADLHISSSASQSNLTILNVSTADYGRYKLNVTNDHGSFVQNLFLEEDTADNGELSENWTKETENATLITGLSLGVVIIVLVVYAASITILYKRKTENKDKQVDVKESTQKTYVNIAYKPNVQEHENNGETTEVDGDGARQYTDLVGYSRDDRTSYEVLQDL